MSRLAILKIMKHNTRPDAGYHVYSAACRLVLLSHFNTAKLFSDHILFSPVIFDLLYWKWAPKQIFFSFWLSIVSLLRFLVLQSLLYYGKFLKNLEKYQNKFITIYNIYPRNHENIINSEPRDQFYRFSFKKRI